MKINNVDEIFTVLESARKNLKEATAHLSDKQVKLRENDKSWTIAEIAEHVGIVLNGVLMITTKLIAQAEKENVKFDGNFNPPLSFAEQINSLKDAKLEAPERIHPQGQQTVAESLAKLDVTLQSLKDLRVRLNATDASNQTFPHPFLGALNLYQWLIVAGLHERRHLQQIKRILVEKNNAQATNFKNFLSHLE